MKIIRMMLGNTESVNPIALITLVLVSIIVTVPWNPAIVNPADLIQLGADISGILGGAAMIDQGKTWGVDVIFEASGSEAAIAQIFKLLCPGGRVIFIGMPVNPVPVDIVAAQAKEARMETVFRYAHIYPRALTLMESGKIDVKPLITDRYKFEDGVKAYEYAANPEPHTVKTVIEM